MLAGLIWLLRSVALWVKPRIETLLDSHIQWMNSSEKQYATQTDILRNLCESYDRTKEKVDEIHSKIIKGA